jgi:Cu2+-exporting ATPase
LQAGASPEDKLSAVARLQREGRRVVMVGDGINDAPVLSRADVSVAMAHGAELARSRADLVLMSSRLGDLVAARKLAKRTLRVIRQNLAWSAIYNAACVPLALAGLLAPWAAGLGMAASSLAVVLNAQRLRTALPHPTIMRAD